MKDGIKAHQFYSWMNIRWLHCNQEKRIFRFEVSASSTKSFIFFFSFQRFFPQNNRIWCLFLTRNFSVDSLSCKINFLSPNFEKKKTVFCKRKFIPSSCFPGKCKAVFPVGFSTFIILWGSGDGNGDFSFLFLHGMKSSKVSAEESLAVSWIIFGSCIPSRKSPLVTTLMG